MKSLLEIITLSADFLKKNGIERPRREAEDVIADALGMKRLDLYLQFERPITEKELEALRDSIKRRANREPSSYISGKTLFADLEFTVSSKVLIPRPETEILVEKISLFLKNENLQGKTLWDMCTGSGCIGISLKKRFPELTVMCSDVSSQALEVAKENAKKLQVDVIFKEGDLFQPFQNEKCDFFVSNPPYVSEKEYKTLAPEIYFEPKQALISGKTGLEFYERIAKDLKQHLSSEGQGWLEIGSGQGNAVEEIFKKNGWQCHFESDWSGHDRFFFLRDRCRIDNL